tara:strand:- start:1408 stop:1824 length:417 start_codon:yes stop_codon:yes gene_type:complete
MNESISAKAKRYGISRGTLSNWRDQGLDLSSDRAIKIRIRGMKGATADSEDLAAAKLRRAVADASKAELAVQQAQGLLCEKAGIRSQGERIGRAIQLELGKAASDLVPQLAGQKSPDISRLLKARFRQIQTNLSQITP